MKKSFLILILIIACAMRSAAQAARDADSVMITIFLKHQQDKNLDSLQEIEKKHKFTQMFPPAGARVISWYVMMGIGQVVTVKIAAGDLRKLNMSIEKGAWGAFNTEFYPTYDYVPVWKEEKAKNASNKN